MGRSQHRNPDKRVHIPPKPGSSKNHLLKKCRKLPRVCICYSLGTGYLFSNPHLGIQDILVGIVPVTCLQKFQHCWWAFGGFQNLWEKNSPFVFSLLLKSLKRTCYEDLSKQNLGRKDLGEMLFLLHKKILLAKTKKHPPVATKQRKKRVVVTVISWLWLRRPSRYWKIPKRTDKITKQITKDKIHGFQKVQKSSSFRIRKSHRIISGNQCLEVGIVASWRLLKLKWPGMLVKALGPEEYAKHDKRVTYCWWFRNPTITSWGKGSLSHYLQGFICQVVVWDFFHQQYDSCDLKRGLFFHFFDWFRGTRDFIQWNTHSSSSHSFIMYVYNMYIYI